MLILFDFIFSFKIIVAERVVAKTDHVFNQKTLTVWLFSEDYILEKPKMIQVLNLPDDITEEYLMLFFEQQDMPFDFSVDSVTINSKQAFAVIEFDHCKGDFYSYLNINNT
jgi:hypothetical protein